MHPQESFEIEPAQTSKQHQAFDYISLMKESSLLGKIKDPDAAIFMEPSTSALEGGLGAKIKSTFGRLIGENSTLHDDVTALVRAGMTAEERSGLLFEEHQMKLYVQGENVGVKPTTPLEDELKARTRAVEKAISEKAKEGLNPLQVSQLERGEANAELSTRYEKGVASIVAQYTAAGGVPKEINQAAVNTVMQEKKEEETMLQQLHLTKMTNKLPLGDWHLRND